MLPLFISTTSKSKIWAAACASSTASPSLETPGSRRHGSLSPMGGPAQLVLALAACKGATNGKPPVDHPMYEHQPPEDLAEDEGDDEEEEEEKKANQPLVAPAGAERGLKVPDEAKVEKAKEKAEATASGAQKKGEGRKRK